MDIYNQQTVADNDLSLSTFATLNISLIQRNKQRITKRNNYQWRSMLPYNRPDCNITPEDKANAHCPTFPAGRPNYSSKTQHQMSLFTKWNNYTSTPRKRELKSTRQEERSSTPTRNTIRTNNRTKITPKKNIFRNHSKSMRNHNITTSATNCKPKGISQFL